MVGGGLQGAGRRPIRANRTRHVSEARESERPAATNRRPLFACLLDHRTICSPVARGDGGNAALYAFARPAPFHIATTPS